MTEIFILLATLIALNTVYFLFLRPKKNVQKKSNTNTKTTSAIFLLKDSYTVSGSQYNLVSYNNGVDWHVMLLQGKNQSIVGRIEDVHPAVTQDSVAWDRLNDYVNKNGAIRLSDKKGSRLLRNCGFDVRQIYS